MVLNRIVMKYFLTCLALGIAFAAGAQIADTILTGNAVYVNLNLSKLDSTISSMQELIEAQQATIESLQAGSFDGDYNSLSNLPTIPSKTSDLSNDAGFTTFDGNYNSLSNQLSQKDIVEFAYSLSGANLSGAHLSNANLSGANLHHANLSGANLSVADLSNANLSVADLSNANLDFADLTGAHLPFANFTGADLSDVTWTGAYILNCTGCPCEDADNDNFCD